MDLSAEGNVFGLDESKDPDLTLMADLEDPDIARVRDTGGRVTLAIHDCRKPVLAAINGAVVGIGATMTLAMDLVLRADILDAEEAKGVGLVDEVTEDAVERAVEVARSWTDGRSAVSVALTRQMVRRNASLPHPADAHRIDSLAMVWTSVGDGKEGVAAFVEKRAPNFTGSAVDLPDFYAQWIGDRSES